MADTYRVVRNSRYYGNPSYIARFALPAIGAAGAAFGRYGFNSVRNYLTGNATPNTVLSRPRRRRAYPAQYARSGRLRYIKSTCTPEIKFHEVSTSQTIGLTGAFVLDSLSEGTLLNIAQNDTSVTRDGSQLSVVGINYRGSIYNPAHTGTQGNPSSLIPSHVRICLVHDREPNGLDATIANDNNGILDASSAGFALKMKCHYNRSRFRFLYDKVFNVTWGIGSYSGATFVGDPTLKFIRFYKPLRLKITYDQSATTGTIASIRNNNLLAFTGGTSHIPGLTLTSRFRIYYMDN